MNVNDRLHLSNAFVPLNMKSELSSSSVPSGGNEGLGDFTDFFNLDEYTATAPATTAPSMVIPSAEPMQTPSQPALPSFDSFDSFDASPSVTGEWDITFAEDGTPIFGSAASSFPGTGPMEPSSNSFGSATTLSESLMTPANGLVALGELEGADEYIWPSSGFDPSLPLIAAFPGLPVIPTSATAPSVASSSPIIPSLNDFNSVNGLPPSKKASTGFRASYVPLDVSAPTQPKTYKSASKTSRKAIPQKYEALVAAVAASPSSSVSGVKRKRKGSDDGSEPFDLEKQIEEGRALNRDAARRSREKKKQTLDNLMNENERLKAQVEFWRSKALELGAQDVVPMPMFDME